MRGEKKEGWLRLMIREEVEKGIGGIGEVVKEARREDYERLREKWQKIIGNENYTCLKDREEMQKEKAVREVLDELIR